MKNIHFNLAITIMVINFWFVGMLRKIFFDTLGGVTVPKRNGGFDKFTVDREFFLRIKISYQPLSYQNR